MPAPDARHIPLRGDTALRVRVPLGWPDPLLCRPVRPLAADEFGPELAQRCAEALAGIEETGVGLAAPQVGDPRAWLVVRVDAEDAGGMPVHLAICNPRVEVLDATLMLDREACLSFPGINLDEVPRPRAIRVTYQDPRDGSERVSDFEDYVARVVLHEVDHLEGRTVLHQVPREKRREWLKAQGKKARVPGRG